MCPYVSKVRMKEENEMSATKMLSEARKGGQDEDDGVEVEAMMKAAEMSASLSSPALEGVERRLEEEVARLISCFQFVCRCSHLAPSSSVVLPISCSVPLLDRPLCLSTEEVRINRENEDR